MMKLFRVIAILALGASLSACATSDIASRNATVESPPAKTLLHAVPQAPLAAPLPSLRVSEITVVVPQHLRVSEANRYYPSGDIVWRGDPIGNRHEQVRAIFESALRKTAENVDGSIPARLDVEVLRFHALTEKARYTTGGVHSITFRLTIRDAKTGEVLAEPRLVEADLDGFGGQQAVEADRRGDTQKVRITAHLAEVLRQELVRPDGYTNAKLGMIQALNKL